tara:strand:- start:247 stop:558 length:312 start_codon:yes stop_codon:yes gene_type:complete
MSEEEKSLIDNVMEDIATSPKILNDDTIVQVRLNKVTTKLVETETLLNHANADIKRLVDENNHLAFVIREMKIKPSSTKFKALMDKVVDTAKKYKLQSPIIRK